MSFGRALKVTATVGTLSVAGFFWGTTGERQTTEAVESVIVQAASLEHATAAVEAVGGAVTHELGIIRAVAAEMTHSQRRALGQIGAPVRSYENAPVEAAATGDAQLDTYITTMFGDTSSTKDGDEAAAPGSEDPVNGGGGGSSSNNGGPPDAYFPTQVGATQLHAEQIRGSGIAIAVVDTGMWGLNGLAFDPSGDVRVPAAYDAIKNKLVKHKRNQSSLSGSFNMDGSGHGSHIASASVNSTVLLSGNFG